MTPYIVHVFTNGLRFICGMKAAEDEAPAEQWSRPKDVADRQSDVKGSIRST
jgi:hypothetical protein